MGWPIDVELKGVDKMLDPCCDFHYPTLACEFQGFRVWGKFVFQTPELMDTPTNLANQVKVGHAFDQSRSVQSRRPERAHQNNEPSWWLSRTEVWDKNKNPFWMASLTLIFTRSVGTLQPMRPLGRVGSKFNIPLTHDLDLGFSRSIF